jgi:hypothetical protein
MKAKFCILLIVVMLASCENNHKKVGNVHYKISFTTDEITVSNAKSAKMMKSAPDDLYTNFGDYITSLTPTKFMAKIWTIGYINSVMIPANDPQMLQYIDQNPDNLSQDDPSRMVDFSNNVTVNFTNPHVYGQLRDGILEGKNIDFKYFYFLPYYLYQEIQLPAQYEGIQLEMFEQYMGSFTTVDNNVLKTQQQPIIRKIFPNSLNTNNGPYFYFGNTDSTFVVNPNGERVLLSENNPAIDEDANGGTGTLIIRSNQYTNAIYHAPDADETLTMSGIVSFNTTDLIQVYAGADNVPYTRDDVFVYAPKFWERISSRLDME